MKTPLYPRKLESNADAPVGWTSLAESRPNNPCSRRLPASARASLPLPGAAEAQSHNRRMVTASGDLQCQHT